jgi:hypothetical protein
MSITLFDQRKDVWAKLESEGCTGLALMARHFDLCADMDRALGYTNATSKWHRGGTPSINSERKARAWLAAQAKQVVDDAPAATVTATILLVACANDVADKARRVLAVLGCEVTEV